MKEESRINLGYWMYLKDIKSLSELERLSGVSYNTLHLIKHNKRGARTETLERIAKTFGCEVRQLYIRKGENVCQEECGN